MATKKIVKRAPPKFKVGDSIKVHIGDSFDSKKYHGCDGKIVAHKRATATDMPSQHIYDLLITDHRGDSQKIVVWEKEIELLPSSARLTTLKISKTVGEYEPSAMQEEVLAAILDNTSMTTGATIKPSTLTTTPSSGALHITLPAIDHKPSKEEVELALHDVEVEERSRNVMKSMNKALPSPEHVAQLQERLRIMRDTVIPKYGLRAYMVLPPAGKLAYNSVTEKWKLFPLDYDTRAAKYTHSKLKKRRPVKPLTPLNSRLKKLKIHV